MRRNHTIIELVCFLSCISTGAFADTCRSGYHEVNIAAKEIAINAGKNWGITPGMLFQVYSEGREMINLDGSSMGKKKTILAILKIMDVQEDFSTAQIIKNGGKSSSLRKGYRVQPITQQEADTLIKQKFFSGSSGKKK